MKRLPFVLVAVIMITVMVMSACTTPTPVATNAPATEVATEAPVESTAVPEPTAIPLGTAENPIIMAMAPSATSQELIAGGEAVAAKLTELTGYTIVTVVPNSYAALVEAMGSGNAHIGWLPPLAYMLAKQKGYADVGLVVVRFGTNHYGVQFVANVESGFTAYFDPTTNTNTADASTALKQFEGKKPCWTDPLSASGYVIPSGMVANEGVKTQAAAMVQGHPTVINALYAGGICDFGATYIDARTTKSVIEAKPDVMEKVVVIYQTDPFIPNDNVSFATTLPEDVRAKLTEALVSMASSEEGQALLKGMGYDVQGLDVIDDTFYDEFQVYLQATGIDVTTLVK
jgi:phosphonate transport system substrate-binding protein